VTTFVDTSALYAVLDRDDAHHRRARAAWQALLGGAAELATSNYVVVETAALVQHRLGMTALRALCDDVLPALAMEWVTPEDHAQGVAAILSAGRRKLSLVDCTSFALMRRLGWTRCFAFDRHFAEQRFEPVG
jgi:predicted nucleic acid-binding protein